MDMLYLKILHNYLLKSGKAFYRQYKRSGHIIGKVFIKNMSNNIAKYTSNNYASHLELEIMNVAYIRVSAVDQNPDRQIEALKPYNIERTFLEKVSGKDTHRAELKAMLNFVRDGDAVYIESISRLARNTLDFLNLVEQFRAKNITLISLKEKIDTSTPQGQFMVSVFAALSQLERDTIRQRQREGIDLALAEGRAYGRPKKPIDEKFMKVYQQWKNGEITAVKAMKLTGYSSNTFYRRVKDLQNASPVKKSITLNLYLRVENNSKFVRGKKRVREEIETCLLSQYNMTKPYKDSSKYEITIPYETDEELDKIIDELFSEMEFTADLRNCFIEAGITDKNDPDRYW